MQRGVNEAKSLFRIFNSLNHEIESLFTAFGSVFVLLDACFLSGSRSSSSCMADAHAGASGVA